MATATPPNDVKEAKNEEKPSKRIRITANNGRLAEMFVKSNSRSAKRVQPKAKLGMLPSMPLDILFEIFGHLLPLDVLHLARTTKALRRVLMRKSAISIWKDALANAPELPECPEDMSYPAFSNLAFDTHCHNCLTGNVRHVEWNLRVRYCTACTKILLVPESDLKKKTTKTNKLTLRCIPFSEGDGRRYCLAKDRDAFRQLYKANDDEPETSLINNKMEAVKIRTEHSKLCRQWSEALAESRASELDSIKYERRMAITEKLSELGYEEELKKLPLYHTQKTHVAGMVLLREHPHVKISKPLTDRSWKNIEEDMILYMEGMKIIRLRLDRLKLFGMRRAVATDIILDYVNTKRGTVELMPGPPDFWAWNDVRRILELPDYITVTRETFAPILPKIPSLLDSWQLMHMQDLSIKNDVEPYFYHWRDEIQLKLATCVFGCLAETGFHGENGQQTCMWYPEYLHHKCNWIGWPEWKPDLDYIERRDDPLVQLDIHYGHGGKRQACSFKELVFNDKASKTVTKIVAACGLNPARASAKDMDDLDARFACLKCSYGYKCDGERSFEVRTWRNAVMHCMSKHWGDARVEWEKISDDDAAQAKALEKLKENPQYEPSIWRCTSCSGTRHERESEKKSTIFSHCHQAHGIKSPEENRDYYKTFDRPPHQPPTIRMVPKSIASC